MLILLLGTNLGNREHHLDNARSQLCKRVGSITKKSSIYQTASWGIKEQPDFLNQALMIEATIPPYDVLKQILTIENQMGRIRSEKKYISRTIDIDIIFFDRCIVDEPGLNIPHPKLTERRFVLEPLAELIPDFVHPILGKDMKELLRECLDPSDVRLYKTDDGSGEHSGSEKGFQQK